MASGGREWTRAGKGSTGRGSGSRSCGEIHPLTLTDGEETGVITARELRAIFEWQNKKLAEIQHCEASPYGGKQANKVGGSRGWQRLQQAKNKLRAKTARQIRDKVSRAAVEWVCVKGQIAFGDVQEVANGKRLKRKKQQKGSQWAHGRLRF
jgi:putative transposase